MRKDNPAVYECPKSKNTLHHWKVTDGIATCVQCKLVLSKDDTDDMLRRTWREDANYG